MGSQHRPPSPLTFPDQPNTNNWFHFFGATLGQDLRDSDETPTATATATANGTATATATANDNNNNNNNNNIRYYDSTSTTRNAPAPGAHALFRDCNNPIPIMGPGLARDAVWNDNSTSTQSVGGPGDNSRNNSRNNSSSSSSSNRNRNQTKTAYDATTTATAATAATMATRKIAATGNRTNEMTMAAFGNNNSTVAVAVPMSSATMNNTSSGSGSGSGNSSSSDNDKEMTWEYSHVGTAIHGMDRTPVDRTIFDNDFGGIMSQSNQSHNDNNKHNNKHNGNSNNSTTTDNFDFDFDFNFNSGDSGANNNTVRLPLKMNDNKNAVGDSNSNSNSNNAPEIDQLTQSMSETWSWYQQKGRYFEYKNEDLFEDAPYRQQHTAAVEKLQARELFEMNVDEREAINNEIHGVQNRSVEENPGLIASALSALHEEIDQHFDEDYGDPFAMDTDGLFTKEAHKVGVSNLQSAYIQSDNFRIRFLRKALFDVREAAMHYFRYLDLIYNFFGEKALLRPLYLTDLTPREIEYFKRGQQQLFPSRDQSGRRIFAFTGCNNTRYTLTEKYRTMTYLFDVLSQDEATQKLGLVVLTFILRSGKVDVGGKASPRFFQRAHQACPVRIIAYHMCFPGNVAYNLAQMIVTLFFPMRLRSVLRFHRGSMMENNYNMCGYGIPFGDIPLTASGKVKTKHANSFLSVRAAIEAVQKKQLEEFSRNRNRNRNHNLTTCNQQSNNSCSNHSCVYSRCFPITIRSIIECPDHHCVIFGDKKMAEHPGNVQFRAFLLHMEQKRSERIRNFDETVTSVASFVDDSIEKARDKCRFRFYGYKRTQSLYTELTDADELHRRVHLMLRDLRKRSRVAEGGASVSVSISGIDGASPTPTQQGDVPAGSHNHTSNNNNQEKSAGQQQQQQQQQPNGPSMLGRNISHKRTKIVRGDSPSSSVLSIDLTRREGCGPFFCP